MLSFNILNNKLYDFIDSSNKDNIIFCHETQNAISIKLLDIKKKTGTSHFKMELRALKNKGIINYFKIKKEIEVLIKIYLKLINFPKKEKNIIDEGRK